MASISTNGGAADIVLNGFLRQTIFAVSSLNSNAFFLQVTVDKAFQREIEGLGVKCANHAAGCKWKGVLKEFYVSS